MGVVDGCPSMEGDSLAVTRLSMESLPSTKGERHARMRLSSESVLALRVRVFPGRV